LPFEKMPVTLEFTIYMRRIHFRFPVTTLAGSTLKNIRDLQDNHTVESRYRKKFFLSKVAAGILEVFNVAERIVWGDRLRNHRLQNPPVFIIGFWRSGTTLLHNLLCQDPEAAYTTTFQTVFPNILLTQSWWLKPFTNQYLPSQRPYDNVSMDMDFPQEEDFGMMNLQSSTIYKFFLFPAEFDQIIENEIYTGKLSPAKISAWKQAYLSMIAKAEFNTHGTRYIGKNPCHLSRIGLLLEMFPEAKFIFIHRHPYKVIESLYQFMLTVFPGVQLQDVPSGFSREKVVGMYTRMMNAYFLDKEKIPSSNLVEVKMDTFVSDPLGELKTMYEQLGLGDFGRASARMEKFLTDNPCPEHNAVPPQEETVRLVKEHAAAIMEQLGYLP